jgi:hypothetical protein
MRNDSTVFVALDVHQKSIVAAYAVDAGAVEELGQIGILQRDLDRLCKRTQAKGSQVRWAFLFLNPTILLTRRESSSGTSGLLCITHTAFLHTRLPRVPPHFGP